MLQLENFRKSPADPSQGGRKYDFVCKVFNIPLASHLKSSICYEARSFWVENREQEYFICQYLVFDNFAGRNMLV